MLPPELQYFVKILLPAAVHFLKRTQKLKPARSFFILAVYKRQDPWGLQGSLPLLVVVSSTQQWSKVSTVGSGHGHCIYGPCFNLSTQTRQDRGSYDGTFFIAASTSAHSRHSRSRHSFLAVRKPTEGEQVLGTDMALSKERFKGQREEKAS